MEATGLSDPPCFHAQWTPRHPLPAWSARVAEGSLEALPRMEDALPSSQLLKQASEPPHLGHSSPGTCTPFLTQPPVTWRGRQIPTSPRWDTRRPGALVHSSLLGFPRLAAVAGSASPSLWCPSRTPALQAAGLAETQQLQSGWLTSSDRKYQGSQGHVPPPPPPVGSGETKPTVT